MHHIFYQTNRSGIGSNGNLAVGFRRSGVHNRCCIIWPWKEEGVYPFSISYILYYWKFAPLFYDFVLRHADSVKCFDVYKERNGGAEYERTGVFRFI